MLNVASPYPSFAPGIEIDSRSSEGILDNIKSALAHKSKNFTIAIHNHSTASLFLIDIPEYFLQQEESVPRVSYVAQNSTLPWVDRIVEFSGNNMEDAALKEISEVTTKLKLSHGETQISAGLSQLSRYKLPDIVAIALLRNTFSFRSKVSCWGEFFLATDNALCANGKDSKKLLRGLKK